MRGPAFVGLAVALLSLGACDDECVGTLCGACAPAITVTVNVEGAIVTAASGVPAEELACSSAAGRTTCQSSVLLVPGSYAYDVAVAGRTQSISVVVGRGTAACCDCGFAPASKNVVFQDDGGA